MSAPTFHLSADTSRAVREVLISRGCVEYDPTLHRVCDLHWTNKQCLAPPSLSSPSFLPSTTLSPRLVNHLPCTSPITQKDNLARTMRRMRAVYGRVYSFTPLTFILPREHSAWLSAACHTPSPLPHSPPSPPCEESKEQITFLPPSLPTTSPQWILKPTLSSQGRGISLPLHPPPTPHPIPSIAQRYILPHLLFQHKYDLRLYLLVTSLRPLVAYTCDEGLCRFARSPYHPSSPALSSHLTNSSLPHTHTQLPSCLPPSGKWTLRRYGKEVVGGAEGMWAAVLPLLLLTLVPLVPTSGSMGVGGGGGGGGGGWGGFEVLGVDVMRDEGGKWWVVEVNRSPSMVVKGEEDEQVKGRLLRDLMDIIGVRAEGTRGVSKGVGGGERLGCWRPLWPTTLREVELNERVSEARMRHERLPAVVVAIYQQAIVDTAKRRLRVAKGAAKGCIDA